MAIIEQRIHHIHFILLKGLRDLIIGFEPHQITGIFGTNGSGKSSLLHALLCIYKPAAEDRNRKNYRFSQFFTPTTHTKWVGSSFKIDYSFRQDQNEYLHQQRVYSKQVSRWKPRYENRPERNIYFIGLITCVPEIELEKKESLITLSTRVLEDNLSNQIIQRASYILNRNYQEYNVHSNQSRRKNYIGLKYQNTSYSSLSMGAGEQRVFKILEVVFRCPKYSMIVIDELDSTLHTDALNKLLDVLINKANDKNLQLVFTSHREELSKRNDINIRHIYQTNTNTICFNHTNPDCLARLTGYQIRPIELFVEDDLAEAIAQKVSEEMNIARHCSIKRFGAATNSFSLAAGMLLKGENLESLSIFIDGDLYRTAAEREEQIKKYFSGNEPNSVQRRANALSCIRQFDLPVNISPEQFINQALTNYNDGSEVCNAANHIQAVIDRHQYVDEILQIIGYSDKMHGLIKVVEKLSRTPEWIPYTNPLRTWLQTRVIQLHL